MIEEMSDEPIRYLINTHLNDDHHAGNQFFRDAVIIGHANCRSHLEDIFLDKPENIEQVKTLLANLKSQLDSFDPASQEAALHRVYFGPGHTDSDLAIFVAAMPRRGYLHSRTFALCLQRQAI